MGDAGDATGQARRRPKRGGGYRMGDSRKSPRRFRPMRGARAAGKEADE